jgi:cysteinyl-tRNA synthetase
MMPEIKLIVVLLIFHIVTLGCNGDSPNPIGEVDYREEMRDFVGDISNYAKSSDPEFLIIPQNGQELLTRSGDPDGILELNYIASIDATGREDMFYGYDADNKETPADDAQYLLDLCLLCEQNGIEVLATDYCWTKEKVDNSYLLNEQNGFISFAADERELNNIPEYPAQPNREHANDVEEISQARNLLYLINGGKFSSKQEFVNALSTTNYDLIIMDLFQEDLMFTADEVSQLKVKSNGGRRLVICYMSIGEAEDYRYYWQEGWRSDPPFWLEPENPAWEGNFKIRYWEDEWQNIIFGNADSYLQRILDAGFDGVYLDIVEGYEYFEEN